MFTERMHMTKATEVEFVPKAAEPLVHQHAPEIQAFGHIEESRTRIPEEPGAMDIRKGQPNRGASIIAADLDHHAESLDAVAGSEFVDDRIRLRE